MKIFITGILGLVGSTTATMLNALGHDVYGIDNDMRGKLFGKEGSTLNIRNKLENQGIHIAIRDIRSGAGSYLKGSDVVIHCAAQPSHEYSINYPFTDLGVNTEASLVLLEAIRIMENKPIVIYTSTIKVYGDIVNEYAYEETKERYWLRDIDGFDETLSIDGSGHSPFGISKLAADLYFQDYAKDHDIPTGIFRMGCITGTDHQGVELHGFLSYLNRCFMENKEYHIFGNGKQVRDQLHVVDLVNAFIAFIDNPKTGVYNLGGGVENSVSILESIRELEQRYNKKLKYTHKPQRHSDHRIWITDNTKFEQEYPEWEIIMPVEKIFNELYSLSQT